MDEIIAFAKVNLLGGITIPKDIRELLNIKPKDKVFFIKDGNKIVITKGKK